MGANYFAYLMNLIEVHNSTDTNWMYVTREKLCCIMVIMKIFRVLHFEMYVKLVVIENFCQQDFVYTSV